MFKTDDRIELITPVGGYPVGTLGTIIGNIARPQAPATGASVRFDGANTTMTVYLQEMKKTDDDKADKAENSELSLLDKVKALNLDANSKLLVKYGVINTDGAITREGMKLVLQTTLDNNRVSIVGLLKKVDQEFAQAPAKKPTKKK